MDKVNFPLTIFGSILALGGLGVSLLRLESYWAGILSMLLFVFGIFFILKARKKSQ